MHSISDIAQRHAFMCCTACSRQHGVKCLCLDNCKQLVRLVDARCCAQRIVAEQGCEAAVLTPGDQLMLAYRQTLLSYSVQSMYPGFQLVALCIECVLRPFDELTEMSDIR